MVIARRQSGLGIYFWLAYSALILGGLIAYVKGIQDGTWLEFVTTLREFPLAIPPLVGFTLFFSKLLGHKWQFSVTFLGGITVIVLIGAAISILFY